MTTADFKKLNRTLTDIKENIPITILKLERELLTVVCYSDAGFANNSDLT